MLTPVHQGQKRATVSFSVTLHSVSLPLKQGLSLNLKFTFLGLAENLPALVISVSAYIRARITGVGGTMAC